MNVNKIILSIIDNLKKCDALNLTPCFVFDRISDKPEESKSLEYQDYHAVNYTKAKGLYIVQLFSVVESGWSSETRKKFMTMLDLSEKFGVKDLVFKNSDRLTRNWKDLLKIQEMIEKKDYRIHFFESYQMISSESDYNAKGTLEILIWAAKRHSDKISHDIKASNKFKIDKGIALFCPIGYKYNSDKRVHVIDEKTETELRWIFNEFDSGKYALSDFVILVNSTGIKTRNGKTWTKSTLHSLLTNPFYHGEFYSRKDDKVHQGNHEAYYEKDRYLKRLERLSSRGFPRKSGKRNFFFTHLIRCTCGAYYYGDLKKDRYVYYEHPCPFENGKHDRINEEELFRVIDEKVNGIQMTEHFTEHLKEIFKDLVNARNSNKSHDLDAITKKVKVIEAKKDKFFELYAASEIDKEDVIRKIAECKREIEVLEKQKKLLSIEQEDFVFRIADVIDDFKNFPQIYALSSQENKAKLLKQSIDVIEKDGDTFTILFKDAFKILYKPELFQLQEEVRVCQTLLPR